MQAAYLTPSGMPLYTDIELKTLSALQLSIVHFHITSPNYDTTIAHFNLTSHSQLSTIISLTAEGNYWDKDHYHGRKAKLSKVDAQIFLSEVDSRATDNNCISTAEAYCLIGYIVTCRKVRMSSLYRILNCPYKQA